MTSLHAYRWQRGFRLYPAAAEWRQIRSGAGQAASVGGPADQHPTKDPGHEGQEIQRRFPKEAQI